LNRTAETLANVGFAREIAMVRLWNHLPMSAAGPWAGTLYLALGRALYVGIVHDTKPHAHHAIQACFSLEEPFGLRASPTAPWASINAAIVPTNVLHQLDGRGHPLAILYLDPESEQGRTAVASRTTSDFVALDDDLLARVQRAIRGAAVDEPIGIITPDLFDALFRILNLAPLYHAALDQRIVSVLEQLRADPNRYGSMVELAASVKLSSRRLRELFKAETGISCQRALLWTRLSQAVLELTEGKSITDAAHSVGFTDAAYLTRTFQRMFGVAPSTLGGIVRLGSVREP
jgi:AraC family transcriptional regulator